MTAFIDDICARTLRILNIPDELQHNMGWAVSTMELIDPNTGKLDKAPRNAHTGRLLSVTDPEGWCSFEEVINAGYPAIGMRLTPEDPYVVIDLDKSKSRDINVYDKETTKARKIYEAFESYSERSYSEKGVHIIVKGKSEKGRRRDNVEIYSQERYIICTGNVLKNRPIIECSDLLGKLYTTLDPHENPDTIPHIDSKSQVDSEIGRAHV